MSIQKLLKKKQRAIEENNLQQLALASNNLGNLYQEKQEYQQALEQYTDEAKAYKTLEKRLDTGKAYRMIGEMYMLLEDFEKAVEYELKYFKAAKEENNQIEKQRAYATLGRVYLLQAQSNPDGSTSEEFKRQIMNAEKSFQKSLEVCESLTNQPKLELLDMKARLYLNLGVTYECKEDYEKAIKFMENAMNICRHNDFWDLLHQCYFATGSLYTNRLDDATKALRFYNLAVNIAERLSSNRVVKICQTLLSKSEVIIKLGDFQSAKQVLHKAYKLKTSDVSDRETIEKNLKIVVAMCRAQDSLVTTDTENYMERRRLYELMGDGACKLKNYKVAISYYLNMLEVAEQNNEQGKDLIPIYVSLYQTYKDNKEYSLALNYMWKEYELCRDVNKEAFNTLFGIAQTSKLAGMDFWDVDGIYERAKKEAQAMGDKNKEKLVLCEQIELRKKCGMETMAELLRKEATLAGFTIKEETDDQEGDGYEIDSEPLTEELNTPEVGEDICLDDLSDSANESEDIPVASTSNNNNSHRLRRRGCFKVVKNEKGETQLHRASISGNIQQARRLLDQGHPVNLRDHCGWLPLHEAANHGYKEIVELLLDHGASINDKGGTKCDGITPLHDACGNGCLEVVELLLDRGANATLRNDLNKTPLDSLEHWRKGVTLNASEQSFFEIIHSRLKQKLDKAGIQTAIELTSPAKSPIKSPTRARSKSTTPRKRLVISPSSSDDENIETVDDILDEAFPNAINHLNETQYFGSSPPSSLLSHVDYREVMEDIRKGNQKNKVEILGDTLRPVEKISKRSGLLAENELDYDNWLEDDVGPSRKKRRYTSDPEIQGETSGNARDQTSHGSGKRKLQSASHFYDNDVSSTLENNTHAAIANVIDDSDNTSDDSSRDAFNILMSSNGTGGRTKKRKPSFSSNRSTSDGNLRQQSSLLENGFSRHRIESPDTSQYSVSSTVISPFKHSMGPVSTASVKVKVKDDLLNVPVNRNVTDDLTIEWLAEEAAKRYYNLKGLKPILRLTTIDGAIFENSDPLSLALCENSVIASTVLEWIMPPLAQRYAESCSQFKTNADSYIQSQLELISSTQSLSITDQILIPKLSRPLLKSIHFQSNLAVIDLTNSFLEDDGIKYLAQALPTISQLTTLNLSGSLITSSGIKYLATIFDTHPTALSELRHLNLNYNPLQNQSLSLLSKFCINLPQLKNLYLSSTELTDLEDYDLNFNALTELDLSLNSFVPAGLVKALEKINASQIIKLNLAFCSFTQNVVENAENENLMINSLINTFSNSTSAGLEELYLTGCNLNDVNCWRILQNISRSKVLRTISLRDNKCLSKVSWKFLLENICTKNLLLEGCKNLVNDITDIDAENFSAPGECSENIYLSLENESGKEAALVQLQKIWNVVSRCSGKIFINDMRVLMTRKPDSVSTDEWHYCYI